MELPQDLWGQVAETVSEELECARRKNHWAVILGLVPFYRGGTWHFRWGDNPHTGLSASGPTVLAAMKAFDIAVEAESKL